MTDDPVAALQELARERGRALLAQPPFVDFGQRATLLLATPPTAIELSHVPVRASLWLLLEQELARTLPAPFGAAIGAHRAHVGAVPPGDDDRVALTIHTDIERLAAGTARRSLEIRWLVRHAEPIVDALGRLPRLIDAASQYPDDSHERIVRTVWLQAHSAVGQLDLAARGPSAASVVVAGEALAALCRVACVLDEGDHPPVEYLLDGARSTRTGRRLATWFDDVASAGHDEKATRRAIGTRTQVLREIETLISQTFRGRDWLRDPETFALRVGR